MFQPNYTISDRILGATVKLEVDKTWMSNIDYSTGTKTTMKEEAKSFNIFHLAHMLGMNLTVKDAQKISEGRKLELEGPRAKVLNNYRNVIEFNRSSVAESYVDLDLTLLLHLNKLVLSNWREPWDVKVRTIGEQVDHEMELFSNLPGDFSGEGDIQSRLIELTEWFKISSANVHPLIRISILVAELSILKPFQSANSITIMAVTDFFMTRYGYTGELHMPLTRTFDLYGDEYKEALEVVSRDGDLTYWIEKLIRNLAKEVHEQKIELEKKLGAEKERNAKQPFLDLNKRQLKVLKYLQSIPTVKREDYCQMMDISTMTAYRDLDDLVKKKLIKVDGRGRGTKYMLISR